MKVCSFFDKDDNEVRVTLKNAKKFLREEFGIRVASNRKAIAKLEEMYDCDVIIRKWFKPTKVNVWPMRVGGKKPGRAVVVPLAIPFNDAK
jgi:hypothetical protein